MRNGFTQERKYPTYLDWVREQECAACCIIGQTEAHHLKGDLNASGAGLKAPDYLAMPLCRVCHAKIHECREGWREAQREALLRTLMRAFEHGVIGIKE